MQLATVVWSGATRSLTCSPYPWPPRLVIGGRNVDKLSKTQRECQTHTPDVHTVIGDVSEERVCRGLVEAAVDEYGGIDIVIINAAMTSSPPEEFVKMENPVNITINDIYTS